MTRREGAKVKLSGRIVHRTEKALLFEMEAVSETGVSYKKQLWFPESTIHAIHNTYSVVNETLDSIVVSEWIARQKDLLEYTCD